MKIVIPSYNRAKLLVTHRLFPLNCVVVIPETQLKAYREYNPDLEYVTIPDYLDGNIAKKRNAILNLFPHEQIVMLDDDVIGFFKLDKNNKLMELLKAEIPDAFNIIFSQMERFNFQL